LNAILPHVKDIVLEEINNLSKFFPYNIKKFFDKRLIYSSNILTFIKPNLKLSDDFVKKLVKLIAGIELLALGVNLHSFDVDDFVILANNIRQKSDKEFREKSEKQYTVDLLFGDICYSRAVIFLLEYRDFYIFESILDSLKSAHLNRILLHQKLVEALNTSKRNSDIFNNYEVKMTELIGESMDLIIGINSLLKTSFIIGWGLFSDYEDFKFPYDVVNNFILYKAYSDLEIFFENLPEEFYFLKKNKYINRKKNSIKKQISNIISTLKPDWLKNNFRILERLYLF
jgi:hypothetical protein